MLIQNIIIKLTQPLVKATKMLMFQCHKIIAQLDKPSASSEICFHPIRSYPRIVANSAFPPPSRARTTAARPRSARSARTACPSYSRSKKINRCRRIATPSPAPPLAWISIDEDNHGYFASPDGATESCDYDKD